MDGDFWLDKVYSFLLVVPKNIKDLKYSTSSCVEISIVNKIKNNFNFLPQGDSLQYHDKMPFPTFDVDNDLHDNNCARNHGNGANWWGNCGFQNPNGVYGNDSDKGVEFMWRYNPKDDLKKYFKRWTPCNVQMKNNIF